ncbi:NACHT domain-containing protein [Colletotrichum cuscutae]|uniref:NACHT domain-containing protein n=1 Tax=Colletotrichum cuscutae TaxID=1209917 RepID=A0AAI9UVA4_9PEZI|nr:NACHT domain-containing protein [Colletotrichum cuscutae]
MDGLIINITYLGTSQAHSSRDSLPRLSRYGDAFPDQHNFQQLLGHIYEDIIDFHCHAYRLVRKSEWAMLFSTCWGRFQYRYDSLLASIAKTADLIDKEAASYEIVQAREQRQKLLEEARDREKREEIHHREAVKKWLQVSDRNEEKLEWLRDRCLDGTSQWVTGSSPVRSWLQKGRGNPVLWLHGKPGSGKLHRDKFLGHRLIFKGKSILCSQLIYFLRSSANWNCLFFFCDFHTTGYGVTAQVLRSMCAQILDLIPETASFMHKECVDPGKKPTTLCLKVLIPKLFSFFKDLRLVIDGVDEIGSSEHGELIKTLTKLADTQDNFRLLISSQDILSIARNLKSGPTLIIGEKSVRKDIELIVSSRL